MPKARKRLTIIGAGQVGATAAHWAAMRNMADIVLFDINEGLARGKALDLLEAAPIGGFDVKIVGTSDYADTADSDVVIVTAGSPRKPGMSRDDLLKVNHEIVAGIAKNVVKYSPDAYIIVVTNPVDVMTYVTWRESGLPTHHVVGQAGVLDTTRYCTFIAQALDISPQDVSAFVLGGHGDSMVPLVRYTYAGGIPVEQLLPKAQLDAIVARTRQGGGEIVELLKTGSAFFAPGAAAIKMAEAILRDRKRILPAIAYLDGEFGERDIYVGVPIVLGGQGVERVIEVELTPEEQAAFKRSIAAVREPLRLLQFV